MVASTSFSPGAEMITFFAPPAMCSPALALEVNKPVHSSTTSTPCAPHGQLGRVALGEHLDAVALDHQVAAVDADLVREPAVRGVVAGQMGVGLGVAEVVDRHDLDFVRAIGFVERAQDVAADAAVAVDRDLDGHECS